MCQIDLARWSLLPDHHGGIWSSGDEQGSDALTMSGSHRSIYSLFNYPPLSLLSAPASPCCRIFLLLRELSESSWPCLGMSWNTVYSVQCTVYSVQCTLYSVCPEIQINTNQVWEESKWGLYFVRGSIKQICVVFTVGLSFCKTFEKLHDIISLRCFQLPR